MREDQELLSEWKLLIKMCWNCYKPLANLVNKGRNKGKRKTPQVMPSSSSATDGKQVEFVP